MKKTQPYVVSEFSTSEEGEHLMNYIEKSIKKNWNKPALTDYQGATLTYKDVARKIEKLHLLYENAGLKPGDKIALCSRNCSNWGVALLSGLSYGAVMVPILQDFKPDNIHQLVNHSDAKLLFAGSFVWENLDENAMPGIDGVVGMEDFSIRFSRNRSLINARHHLNELFGKKYPERFGVEEVSYRRDNLDDLALINYTSGTTSAPKGVMLSYRSLWTNTKFACEKLHPGDRMVSMLPMAHMYGLVAEFLYPFSSGTEINFLSRTPSPKIILDAFQRVKPTQIITVPLILEKIVKKQVFPKIQKPSMKALMLIPGMRRVVLNKIYASLRTALGGNFFEVCLGGAAINKEVELFLREIKFPYTVGYGMTECGPLVAYEWWNQYKQGSCGIATHRTRLRIDSPDPENIVGEILVKGPCLMMGYYKNPTATEAAFTSDGWLKTGDLGVLDSDGFLFIRGRIKNMILSSSGQNIYPEEIEDQLNNLPYVNESLVVEKDGHLIALIVPDFEGCHHADITDDKIQEMMDTAVKGLNTILPGYSQIAKVRIMHEEFEKTPKRSIKRFMYQQ